MSGLLPEAAPYIALAPEAVGRLEFFCLASLLSKIFGDASRSNYSADSAQILGACF